MSRKYRSGFERLSRTYQNSSDRYSVALAAVKENFNGFTNREGYNLKKVERLSENQKRQIRRYYNLLSEYTEGAPVYKMRPSELPARIKRGGRKNIDAVMRAAQMPEGRKRAKYIFIKYDGETIPRVSVKNNVPVFVNDKFGYSKEIIELNKEALALDARETIMSISDLTSGARFYRIVNGRHEFFNAADLETLAEKIEQLQQKYAIGTKDGWDKWLYGVAAFYSNTRSPSEIINHQRVSNERFKQRIKRESEKLRRKRK